MNSEALKSEQSSKGRPRPNNQRSKVKTASVNKNYPKSRPDISPTPSLSKYNPDKHIVLVQSTEDDIPAPDLMPTISADEDGFLTVTDTVITRTKELYEETLTSLSEVIIYLLCRWWP